jgi:hypothetical protein
MEDLRVLLWKVVYFIAFAWGAIAYAIGSALFFPGFTNCLIGAWLLTFGSAGFVVSDAMDLYSSMSSRHPSKKQNIIVPDHKAIVKDHKTVMVPSIKIIIPDSKVLNQYQPNRKALNISLSLVGSLLYLVGQCSFFLSSTVQLELFYLLLGQ